MEQTKRFFDLLKKLQIRIKEMQSKLDNHNLKKDELEAFNLEFIDCKESLSFEEAGLIAKKREPKEKLVELSGNDHKASFERLELVSKEIRDLMPIENVWIEFEEILSPKIGVPIRYFVRASTEGIEVMNEDSFRDSRLEVNQGLDIGVLGQTLRR